MKIGQAREPARVNGYGRQEFPGKVKFVSPTANATTRQVEVIVEFAPDAPARLRGAVCRGPRRGRRRASALMIPDSTIVRDGEKTFAWRVKGDALQKVELALGERDTRAAISWCAADSRNGDRVLRHPTTLLKDGQAVMETKSAQAASPLPGAAQTP